MSPDRSIITRAALLVASGLAAYLVGQQNPFIAAPASADDPAITPDEWGMDDGRGVGPRVAGTPCLAAEAHSWADSANGSGIALWCPPPTFVWVPAA